MEFTKAEHRLLSRKQNVALLWIGVVLIAVAVPVAIFGFRTWKKVDAIWEGSIAAAEGTRADGTPAEAMLKEKLVATMHSARELNRKYIDQATQKAFLYFFLGGCACIGGYFRSRGYLRIIDRLRMPAGNGLSNREHG